MTVTYLQTICRYPLPTLTTSDPPDRGGSRYAAGYRQCAVEVAHYLADVVSRGNGGDGLVNVVRAKLMRHLTAILQTKMFCQPHDNELPSPPPTSSFPPEPEIGRRSCCDFSDSGPEGDDADCGRSGFPASFPHSGTGNDDDDAVSVSPTCRRPVDPAVSPSLASASPSNFSAADLDVMRAQSVDCGCVWRPW